MQNKNNFFKNKYKTSTKPTQNQHKTNTKQTQHKYKNILPLSQFADKSQHHLLGRSLSQNLNFTILNIKIANSIYNIYVPVHRRVVTKFLVPVLLQTMFQLLCGLRKLKLRKNFTVIVWKIIVVLTSPSSYKTLQFHPHTELSMIKLKEKSLSSTIVNNTG